MTVLSRLCRLSVAAAAVWLAACAELPAQPASAPAATQGSAPPAATPRPLNREAEVLVTLAALHEDSLNQSMTLLPLVRERAQRKPLERSIQLHANELRTLRGWISRLPDRPQADYLPRLPEPGALTRAQAERQYVQAMLAHHDAVEQLARRAEGVRLRPALKTLLETARARSQAERPALQARLDALP